MDDLKFLEFIFNNYDWIYISQNMGKIYDYILNVRNAAQILCLMKSRG